MKNYLMLVCFILTGCTCQLFAQEHGCTADHNPIDQNVTHYRLFVNEVADTTVAPFVDSCSVDSISSFYYGSFNSDSLKLVDADSIVIMFTSLLNGKYIQVALSAVHAHGESTAAVSFFKKKRYSIMPTKPSRIKLID